MIVAAGFGERTAHVASVAELAEIAYAHDASALAAILDTPRDWQAVLLGPALERPLDVARRVRARYPDVPIVVLAEPTDAARLQHDLLLAPIPGDPVRCVPMDPLAPEVLERHLRRSFLRRRHVEAMHRANQAMATPAAVVPRLPPAMEQLIEATPVPLLVVDRAGRLIHRNRAARALHGGRATTLSEALAGADIPAIERLIEVTTAAPLRRVSWNGRCFDLLTSPLSLPPAIDAVLVILDDVSDAVREEEARRREAELHATILAVQNDLGEGLCLLDKDRVVYANEALARMLGRDLEELGSLDPFHMVAEADRERVRTFHHARRRGDASPESYETAFVRKDGSEFPVEVSARVTGADGLAVVIVRDITRRREMQRDVEDARAGLAQMDKLATVGSLVSGLAHEIRTPLAAIVNEAHLIQRHVERALAADDPKAELHDVRERVESLDGAIDRIRRLMKDMQSFMRGEAPHKQRVALGHAVEDAVRFFASTQRGNVRLELRTASEGLVDADTAQVQQILINLLQNAAEASPSGGTVTVELTDEPASVVLAVADRGTGIPPEVKARMFDAFVTTKSRGSGLGLAIVRRLAEIHGARIHVDSEVGAGTRVEVRFPRVTASGPS